MAMTTRQARVTVRLREMILRGELTPGERITEIDIAKRLGVSRTPIRQALPALAQEGLLTLAGARGYMVRAFTVREVIDAIDVRGMLEGLAGRLVAERGATRGLVRDLHACLDDGDAIFAKDAHAAGDESRYADMNARFHALIVAAAGSNVVADAIAFNDRVPFAAAKSFAFDKANRVANFAILRYAHRQHHAIVQALENGEGARVEALLREHTHPVKESLNFINDPAERRPDGVIDGRAALALV
jgi:GntR family transcriptional regulator of vanillate catabolism